MTSLLWPLQRYRDNLVSLILSMMPSSPSYLYVVYNESTSPHSLAGPLRILFGDCSIVRRYRSLPLTRVQDEIILTHASLLAIGGHYLCALPTLIWKVVPWTIACFVGFYSGGCILMH